jgi:hypothetical protein
VASTGGSTVLVPNGSQPAIRGGRLEESYSRTGSGERVNRITYHSCRYSIGLLRRGRLCSERDAQRRRGHALPCSTGLRLWSGRQLQDIRLCHNGRLVTGRIPDRSARSRAAVRRDSGVGAGPQRDPIDLRTDKRRFAVGEPRRYTGTAAVQQRGTRMCFRTRLSLVARKGVWFLRWLMVSAKRESG